MDCDYVCLNNLSSVHPAFRHQEHNATVSIVNATTTHQLIAKSQGDEYRYQNHSQSLVLQTSSGENRANYLTDESVDYALHTQRDNSSNEISYLPKPLNNQIAVLEVSTQETNKSDSDCPKDVSPNTNIIISLDSDFNSDSNNTKNSQNSGLDLDSNSKEELEIPDVVVPKMPFYITRPESTIDLGNPLSSNTEAVFVPSLDLTSLTMDDESEAHDTKQHKKPAQKEPSVKASVPIPKDNRQQTTIAPTAVGSNGGGAGGILFKKQKMPFVFPSEKSFNDIDVMRSNPAHSQFDDQYYITSVSSYRTNSGVNEPVSGKETEVCYEDGTIAFSLSNPKFGKYMVDGDASKSHKKENNINNNTDKTKSTKTTGNLYNGNVNTTSGSSSLGANDNMEVVTVGQKVYDVIIVNGHSNEIETSTNGVDNNAIHSETNTVGGDKSIEKPRGRVTFSFADSETPRGRYTPIKGDVQLQSVLKKRRAPSPVVQRSVSEDRARGYSRKRDKIINKESVRLFGSSYTLDYCFYSNGASEHGIPVKNVHTTSTDLEKRHSKDTSSTVAEKPPIPSTANRITLSMAERSASNGSVRSMPNRDPRLSATHMRGRMAYFRPAAERSRATTNQNTRSRSSDDLYSLHERTTNHANSSSNSKHNKNASTNPFSLRRCASTERDMQLIDNRNSHRPRPKVAFGSFILPKDKTTRIKPAQVQFHELNNSQQGNLPIGTYVHSHTRRSPYAPPTQVLLNDSRKQEVVSRRPGTGNNQTRYLQQQQQQQQQQYSNSRQTATQSSKHHGPRHSAPSSIRNVKDKHTLSSSSSSHPDRISINTSPTKPQSNRLTAASSNDKTTVTQEATSSKTNPTSNISSGGHGMGAGRSGGGGGGGNADFMASRKANIAHLNTMATRERGVSQHRFMSKLEAFTNGVGS